MQRILHLVVLGCVLALSAAAPAPLDGQTVAANVADLQQQLESGLKARRPGEFAYIKKVVTMVRMNELPLDLVISTFIWVRHNPQARDYPFVYFQRALQERAKKLGITV
ncbi:MAG: hypothetical protein H6822_06375 [Planctomycetaceae bacterium]|nr:hypothetical protein [Planctomycetales bacterium]MCB9921787.1 hypothetical protein [Planctomycetaceae bacterium]